MTEMRQLQPVVMFARSLQAPARELYGDLKHSLLGYLGGFLDSLLGSLGALPAPLALMLTSLCHRAF